MIKTAKAIIIFGLLALTACSSDSESTGSNSPSSANASQCPLATEKLPASNLAWQPNFAGGCEVVQQIELADLQAFDQQLIALGYNKKSLSTEAYMYTLNTKDYNNQTASNDTLSFTYASSFISATFSSSTRTLTPDEVKSELLNASCKELLPENIFNVNINFCNFQTSKGISWDRGASTSYKTDTELNNILTQYGWTCKTSQKTESNGVYTSYYTTFNCTANIEGNTFSLVLNTYRTTNSTVSLSKLELK